MDHLSASVAPEKHSQEQQTAVIEDQASVVISLAPIYQDTIGDGLHILGIPLCVLMQVLCCTVSNVSHSFSNARVESYSALLKSLQEVIHREGFDLATPMVRTKQLFWFLFHSNYNTLFFLKNVIHHKPIHILLEGIKSHSGARSTIILFLSHIDTHLLLNSKKQ